MLRINEIVIKNGRLVLFDGERLHNVPLERVIHISQKGRVMTIFYESIKDTCGVKRKSMVSFSLYYRMKDIIVMLDRRFIRCGRSNIVNMDHICDITAEKIKLTGSIEVPLSYELLKRARTEFAEYITE